MRFSDAVQLLSDSGKTTYVLNSPGQGRPVLVCPALAGRVIGTTCDVNSGELGGFLDADAFLHGMKDIWDNWGGEERYWLCPEGGQFGLMFQGRENCFANYVVQPGINSQEYEVVDVARTCDSLTMQADFELVNAAGTRFTKVPRPKPSPGT